MDDVYDRYGIVLKTWCAAEEGESRKNSYSVIVWGWNYHRRIIERDGLISFQVTVHSPHDCNCYTCEWRVRFVTQQLADQNVQCFWTYESDDDSLYVTVGSPPQRLSPETYLSILLGLLIERCSSPRQQPTKKRKTKARSRTNRHIVH